jgi:diguanylate cyclase (GGDEF)-like protein
VKIGEFAELNKVSAKMLRHYDEIDLFKPATIDPDTGYRSYEAEQSHYLNWILILKNLDFALSEIKDILSGPVEAAAIIDRLVQKRIAISSSLNEHIQKKIAIDQLISIIQKEGFEMNKKIDLLHVDQADVHEIKKNIPNMEMFLDEAASIAFQCAEDDSIAVFRFDISHFKQVNDNYGFEVGDKVIVACYKMIESNVKARLALSAFGRAHGDEFVVFAKADEELLHETAQAIIDDMKRYDFNRIGCPKQMACYIGGIIGPRGKIADIRSLIEHSIESINLARKKGPNGIMLEQYAD